MFVQRGYTFWCPLHIIFINECVSFYVKKYVNDPEGYAADL